MYQDGTALAPVWVEYIEEPWHALIRVAKLLRVGDVTEPAGSTGGINISFVNTEKDGFVRINIANNGIGFENTYAESIFETFKRLNSKDKLEGPGPGFVVM